MADQWEVNFTILEIQEGGPGNPLLLLPMDSTISGPAGGGQSVTTRWVRDYKKGAGAYKSAGTFVDSDPERYTADLSVRVSISDFINTMKKRECMHNLRIREHCADAGDFLNYNAYMTLHETYGTGQTLSENVANGDTAVAVDLKNQVAESAADLVKVIKPTHKDISDSWSDFDINEVISVGYPTCAGDCGEANDGNQDYWAVTDLDTTPGYQGAGAPVFLYTQDGGTTFGASYINAMLGANAIDIIKVGSKALVAGSNTAPAYANFNDILDGVANPWVSTTGTTTPFPNALAQANPNTVWACGNAGRIWKSTDGGATFTLISNGTVTNQNLVDCVFASEILGWFVGANGAIVKYENGTLSLVIAETAAGVILTSNINTVAVPDDRTKEVFLGTAAGTVWRSKDKGGVFTTPGFDGSGTGVIEKLAFSGPRGFHLWLIQTNVAGTKSRVLRDLTGGNLGLPYVEVIGSYDDPPNSVINSIAPSDVNTAITVGQIDGGYGFIGRVS